MINTFEMAADIIGGLTFGSGLLMVGWNELAEYFNIKSINPWLGFITTIIGALFMLSKYKGQRLTNKERELNIKQMQRMERKAQERENRRGDGQEGK